MNNGNLATRVYKITKTCGLLLGSIAYIVKAIGGALSGWVSEKIGRKTTMILVNLPHLIAWPIVFFANSSVQVFLALILLGVGNGFMEPVVITYVGEIW